MDLEEVAISLCPEIKDNKGTLKKPCALGSLMSGSGSAVFGVFEMKGLRKSSGRGGGLEGLHSSQRLARRQIWKSPM